MHNFKAAISGESVFVTLTKRVNQINLDKNVLYLAEGIEIAKVIATYDRTLKTAVESLPKDAQSKIKAITNGVSDIVGSKLAFTATIKENLDGKPILDSFAVRSSTRQEVLYTPDDSQCQCEGYTHNKTCKHIHLFKVFKNYIRILRANEVWAQEYAHLNVTLKPTFETIPNTVTESAASTPAKDVGYLTNAELTRMIDQLLKSGRISVAGY